MAGVVLGDIDFYSGVAAVAALVARLVLGVEPGTPRLLALQPHPPSFHVAGVALCDIHLHFVWQAWHFMTWIVTLRRRRGTYGTGLALVARLVLGVAPGTPRLLAWQPWHLETSTFVSRGRRGTW